MFFCGCVCACDCISVGSLGANTPGHPGQFSRLTNCNTLGGTGIGGWIGCVNGGAAGQGCCTATSWVCIGGPNCNSQFNTRCVSAVTTTLPTAYSVCQMSTAQSTTCSGGSQLCCAGASCFCAATLCSFTCVGTQHCFNELCACTAPQVQCGLDLIFPRVACNCFDNYRRGACGWSCVTPGLGYNATWNWCDIGVGGAAYAGGAEQRNTFSNGNFAYCGWAGNFPGGGGHGGSACGGATCNGSIGGAGLIIISWD